MTVEYIFVSTDAGGNQYEKDQVELMAGCGIVGDRNFGLSKWPGQNLTLIEAEEIESFLVEHHLPHDLTISRRNLITRGVRLNDLVGKQFRLGGVLLKGVELCEPCRSLGERLSFLTGSELSPKLVIQRFRGRGGLRVDALTSGTIKLGVQVEEIKSEEVSLEK